jgi:protein pelota
MLGSDEMRAWYGPDHVALAADRGAIGTLLISDELFRRVPYPMHELTSTNDAYRSSDVNERKKYVALVESVREKRGEVIIFSSMHETGQRTCPSHDICPTQFNRPSPPGLTHCHAPNSNVSPTCS